MPLAAYHKCFEACGLNMAASNRQAPNLVLQPNVLPSIMNCHSQAKIQSRRENLIQRRLKISGGILPFYCTVRYTRSYGTRYLLYFPIFTIHRRLYYYGAAAGGIQRVIQ